MAFSAYARSTSVAQGESLEFRVIDEAGTAGTASVKVFNVITGAEVHAGSTPSGLWSLPIPTCWPSGLYKAVFSPGDGEAHFVVRAKDPGVHARILVSMPFPTWQAYNRQGIPGEGLYFNEQPDRAFKASFDRPTPGPGQWESHFFSLFRDLGDTLEYCSGLTMGVFRKGGGTVFNAATTGWGRRIEDPVVARITQNVLGRLSKRYPANEWEVIGEAHDIKAMAASENWLWAADARDVLWRREPVGQNLAWIRVGQGNDIVAMASPREATGGLSLGLHAVAKDKLWYRDPIPANIDWTLLAGAEGIVALAASHLWLFAATKTDLLYMPFSALGGPAPAWIRVGDANGIVAMTNLNGRLYAADENHQLWMRPPVITDQAWTCLGDAPSISALAGHAGQLFASDEHDVLWRRDAVAW